WQRSWLTGETLEGQLGYWRRRLARPSVLDLPTDRARPAVRDTGGAAIDFRVDPDIGHRLQELSRRSGATMFMTLLAAYTVLLGKYTRQDDLLVGTPVANRNQAETEDLIGFFVNTLVLRADLSGDPTFTDLLHQVRATALEAYGHQDLPFEQLVDELGIERDRSRTPLFQTLFSHFISDDADPDARSGAGATTDAGSGFGGEPGSGEGGGPRSMPVKYDLIVTMASSPDGGLNGSVQYSTALFDQDRIERLIAHLHGVLDAITADPDRPLSALPILTPAEQRQLTSNAVPARIAVPAAGGIHELIAAQARTRPAQTAVLCEGNRLSYRELDERANRLAHHLLALGAGPDSIVGLHVGRTPQLIIAILAVWKAGAAYLP
ncbi:condensation domain-containing protein, partial [Nonomuraea sp. NPDC049269]|uniref:condensation domain-containing protein n=1 Tax=Nonomuraea sp. NPDC049269 TaxID=3364349 RepID=UPI0037226F26